MTSEAWEIAPSGTLALLDKCRHISLTDDEIGRLWFGAALPGVTETQARFLIRANTQRGMSDIMGALMDGRTLAIEVKSRTGRMRPGQEEFLASIRAAGGVAGVCRSVEDAVALLA